MFGGGLKYEYRGMLIDEHKRIELFPRSRNGNRNGELELELGIGIGQVCGQFVTHQCTDPPAPDH